MFISKLKVIAWVIAFSVIGSGPALAKDAGEKPAKPAADTSSQIRGNIGSMEGNDISIGAVENGQKVKKTYTLTDQTIILLAAPTKGEEPKPGKREHVTTGCSVTITPAADGKTITSITIAGKNAGGTIESIDKDSITLTGKGKEGAQTTRYKVNDATTVILGGGKEKGDVQRGTVADLKPGMRVNVSLAAGEKELIRSISVQPEMPRTEKPDKGSKK